MNLQASLFCFVILYFVHFFGANILCFYEITKFPFIFCTTLTSLCGSSAKLVTFIR